MQFIQFFKLSWCKIASVARNWIYSASQAAATTFAFLLSLSFFYGWKGYRQCVDSMFLTLGHSHICRWVGGCGVGGGGRGCGCWRGHEEKCEPSCVEQASVRGEGQPDGGSETQPDQPPLHIHHSQGQQQRDYVASSLHSIQLLWGLFLRIANSQSVDFSPEPYLLASLLICT